MRFVSQSGLVALLATRVLGHPTASPHAIGRRGIDIEAFRLKTESLYSDVKQTENLDLPASFEALSYTETAATVVKELFPNANYRLVSDHYIGNDGIGHVFFKQQVHGIDIDNADFNVNVSPLFPYHVWNQTHKR
jgi:extracellular elastinolytic metalloproteinase